MATYESRAVLPRYYGPLLDELSAPDQLLVSEHVVPSPYRSENPRELVRQTFDAVNTAALAMGLQEMGVPVFGRRRQPLEIFWGTDAWTKIEEYPDRHGRQTDPTFAWPWTVLIWTDPSRTTFLLVSSGDSCITAEQIVAWGTDARRCLAAVDAALDDEALWD